MKTYYIIIAGILSLFFLFCSCEQQDIKEVTATTNLFLKSLQTADLDTLTRISPWINNVEQGKITQLLQAMKDIKEWNIISVNKQWAGIYVSVALKSPNRQQTLLLPFRYQDKQWLVTEKIELSVHLDYVPLK